MTGARGTVVLCGLCFGAGLVSLLATWSPRSWSARSGGRPARTNRFAGPNGRTGGGRLQIGRIGLAAGLGTTVGLLTRWPVAVPLAALAVYGLPELFGRTTGSVSIAKIEAIATWTEMLQGTLAASAGLGQAVMVTAPVSPEPIRPAATRLSARLVAGVHPRDALALFADEIEDPCADRVVCALQLAASARAQRLGDLLSALADSTRDEVALRLRVETSRASVRSGVRTVLVFSVGFAAALAVLAHAYLAPFGTFRGQVVLAAVGILYAVGLISMVALSRPPAPIRLIGAGVVEG